jgi:hypothetical protein
MTIRLTIQLALPTSPPFLLGKGLGVRSLKVCEVRSEKANPATCARTENLMTILLTISVTIQLALQTALPFPFTSRAAGGASERVCEARIQVQQGPAARSIS